MIPDSSGFNLVDKPYRLHLHSSQDLVTSREAIRAGFIQMVTQKNIRSSPMIAEARTLYVLASRAKTPNELLDIPEISAGLITAAGFSNKAIGAAGLNKADMQLILADFIHNFIATQGEQFIEELVYRYLLIRGDSLGGTMRNLAGALAQQRLIEYIAAGLTIAKRPYWWLHKTTKSWMSPEMRIEFDAKQVGAMHWQTNDKDRMLLFNVKLPFVKRETEGNKAGKGVDLCIYDCERASVNTASLRRQLISDQSKYLALGELKGGIDPAGADEHWKTASAHLQNRVAEAFRDSSAPPHLFFVASAIERSMAEELWDLLERRVLTNVANLTKDNHVVSIAAWMCSL